MRVLVEGVKGVQVAIFCGVWRNVAITVLCKSWGITGTGWAGLAGWAGLVGWLAVSACVILYCFATQVQLQVFGAVACAD